MLLFHKSPLLPNQLWFQNYLLQKSISLKTSVWPSLDHDFSQLSLTDQLTFSGSFKIFQSLFWISRSLIFMSFHLNFIFHFPCFQFNFSSISAHYFRSHVQVSRSNHCSLMNNCSLNTRNHTCIGYCSPKVLVKSTD